MSNPIFNEATIKQIAEGRLVSFDFGHDFFWSAPVTVWAECRHKRDIHGDLIPVVDFRIKSASGGVNNGVSTIGYATALRNLLDEALEFVKQGEEHMFDIIEQFNHNCEVARAEREAYEEQRQRDWDADTSINRDEAEAIVSEMYHAAKSEKTDIRRDFRFRGSDQVISIFAEWTGSIVAFYLSHGREARRDLVDRITNTFAQEVTA